jgi:exonuclease SbcC
MRPLRLTMQAFGPYRTLETIDFRELGSNRLFLIQGETGAGKTSILDAMVFALYGDTSGGDREGAQMRCDSAEPSLPTEVTLEFALGPRSYRVTRRPQQPVCSRAGGPPVVQSAKAALWETTANGADGGAGNGEGRLLASQVREVNRKIHELLGFSSQQFRQVVVLPQGKFRDLLAAGSDEREEILKQLFRTEECAALETALAERAKAVQEERKTLVTERRLRLGAAGAESEDELVTLIEAAHSAVLTAAEEVAEAERAWRQTAQALTEAEQADAAYQKVLAARAAVEQLEREKWRIEQLAQSVERARRAARVIPCRVAAEETARDLEQAREGAAAARSRLEEAIKSKEEAAQRLVEQETRASLRGEAQERVRRLEEMRPRVAEWEAAEREREAAEQVLAQTAERVARARAAREVAAAALGNARRRAADVQSALSRSASLAELLEQAEQRVALCRKRESVTETLEQRRGARSRAEAASLEAEKAFEQAASALARLEAAWRAGRAALLARELAPGQPCPVCGSTEHPAPAQVAGEVVDDAALDQGRVALESARKLREEATAQLAAALTAERESQAELKALDAMLPPGLTSAAAAQEAAAHRAEQDELARLIAGCPDPAGSVAAAEEELDKAEKHLSAAREEEKTATAELAARSERARTLAADLPEELRTAGALEQALEAARLRLKDLEQEFDTARAAAKAADEEAAAARSASAAAAEAVRTALARYERAAAALVTALAQEGFADWHECFSAAMDEATRRAAEKEVEDYREAVAQAGGRLQEAEAAWGGSAAALELETLRAQAQAAEERFKEAQKRLSAEETRLGQLEEAARELAKLQARCADVDARYAVIGRLAEVAGGQAGGEKISFQRWVLGTYLDEVLLSASRRLFLMSKGRYRLERRRESGDRRRAAGLDLAVFDGWSDRSRPAVTLSGGESFLAALALALGLAETVQEQAGGTRLETIFVDEGFGALDPDALELAMEALLELKDSGRLVGIISHVPELRSVIDARLEVRGGPGGSCARFVVP